MNESLSDALIARMTLPEKAGQLAQVEKNSITPDEVAEYAIGSVLSGGGGNPDPNNAANWRAMVEAFLDGAKRSRLGVPLLYGTDSVHGHSNVHGATIFPHNIGLGAAGDEDLVERVYQATAAETAATGARWAFAPTVAVGLDPRWGRTYESFGSDTELVGRLGAAAVRGLQGGQGHAAVDGARVAACLKHYVGDGGTTWGSLDKVDWIDWWDGWGPRWKIDQADTRVDEATLRSVHLAPYLGGLAAGSLTVMASYSSWNGEKMHGHHYLLTNVLKDELGFEGFVVSDWLGIDQLDADPYSCAVRAINAGVDMVMVPFEFRRFIDNVVAAVDNGEITSDRLDDAVRRILRVKEALGLFDADQPELPSVDIVGCEEHRALAREAAAASVVRLKDPDHVLPFTPGQSVIVAGAAADDIGLQCGGWTIEWQGGAGPITQGTSIFDGLRQRGLGGEGGEGEEIVHLPDGRTSAETRADVGLVVVAEPPYCEGAGDQADLSLPAVDVELIRRVRPLVDRLVLLILSGRPVVLSEVLEECDAIVAAWLPGTEGNGVADVLVGALPFRGRLPRPWPATSAEVDRPEQELLQDSSTRGTQEWTVGHGVTS